VIGALHKILVMLLEELAQQFLTIIMIFSKFDLK
jgi:hypothetical protein